MEEQAMEKALVELIKRFYKNNPDFLATSRKGDTRAWEKQKQKSRQGTKKSQ